MLTTLSSSFAALAIVLAAIGLYAVLAYGVAQRLREIGIRIALGAKPSDVRRLVLSQVGRISLIGGVIGAGLALGLGRLGQAMLFGVQGYDLCDHRWRGAPHPRCRLRRRSHTGTPRVTHRPGRWC